MKKIMITGCTDPMMWYADQIGKSFEYTGPALGEGFMVVDASGYNNLVKYPDGELFDNEIKDLNDQGQLKVSRIAINLTINLVPELRDRMLAALPSKSGIHTPDIIDHDLICEILAKMLAHSEGRPRIFGAHQNEAVALPGATLQEAEEESHERLVDSCISHFASVYGRKVMASLVQAMSDIPATRMLSAQCDNPDCEIHNPRTAGEATSEQTTH